MNKYKNLASWWNCELRGKKERERRNKVKRRIEKRQRVIHVCHNSFQYHFRCKNQFWYQTQALDLGNFLANQLNTTLIQTPNFDQACKNWFWTLIYANLDLEMDFELIRMCSSPKQLKNNKRCGQLKWNFDIRTLILIRVWQRLKKFNTS